MSRISIKGVDIPGNKSIRIALSYIRGIGKKDKPKSMSNIVLQRAGINPLIKAKDLNDEQQWLIVREFDKLITQEELLIEEELEKKVKQNVEKIVGIDCYRGKHHSMKKKVYGQSTRHNNRNRPNGIFCTTKKRETVAGKKAAPKQG